MYCYHSNLVIIFLVRFPIDSHIINCGTLCKYLQLQNEFRGKNLSALDANLNALAPTAELTGVAYIEVKLEVKSGITTLL